VLIRMEYKRTRFHKMQTEIVAISKSREKPSSLIILRDTRSSSEAPLIVPPLRLHSGMVV
jgi:hypothetical protein